ncbi:heparinase II/III domain-containing protein [Paenibacillus ferrarius]|uniref:heparinase II/III domain-containing protein n=1 Tax=Paenibacillus ferrarius TaxID=1469647 RepID=UPI003D2C16A2
MATHSKAQSQSHPAGKREFAEAGIAHTYLQSLVERAEKLLEERSAYYTDGAKLAMGDMVRAANDALDGKPHVPFVRNRQFYAPREEEEVLFATRRYTMAPSYNEEGKVYHEYGLEPALAWFERQDALFEGAAMLPRKAEETLARAAAQLEAARIGSAVGEYSAAEAAALQAAAERLAEAKLAFRSGDSGEELAQALVACLNRLREFRFSRVLRSDVDPAATLYLTGTALQELKQNVAQDGLLHEQYERIASLSERYNLAYLEQATALLMREDANYDEINKFFYTWSSTDKIINFTVPDRAVKLGVSFILPSVENKEDGLGHVWIDNLSILSANGGRLPIENGGFDEGADGPRSWRAYAVKGNPVLKWEFAYPFCGGGDRDRVETANPSSQVSWATEAGGKPRSIYLCNPTRGDEGAWCYDGDIAIEAGVGYTLTFAAKIDGKFKEGVKAQMTFLDETDQTVGVFEISFNRSSSLPNGCFQLTMQCDAIQYAFTGDATYAQKAKLAILYSLHDFCQGAEHWMATNARPQGSDSYGAVQGGRLLCSTAVTYSLIKKADVFTEEEKGLFYALVAYLLRYMLDLRDRTELTAEAAQRGCSNWQTDMCAGTAYLMLVLDDFPNRKAWLYNAHAVLQAQLSLNVHPDGSWPESIRYHHAALERFAGYAKVVAHMMGDNWFATTRLPDMFEYSVQVQTPGYAFFDGRIGTPPFGDHALSGGAEFGSYTTYLADVAKVNKAVADRMYLTWARAGKPFKKLWGEGIALDNLLALSDRYACDGELNLPSAVSYADAGLHIFRGDGQGSYFAVMSSPQPIGHGHLDQGSFLLYKNAVPLVMDSGIEGYFDSSTSWHISSYSHACVQFATRRKAVPKSGSSAINLSAGTYSLERGWVDVPRTSRVLAYTPGEETDFISIEIMNPEGPGKHRRDIRYLQQLDLYVIHDRIDDFKGEVLFSLPVAAVRTIQEGASYVSEGYYGVALETVFASSVKRSWIEQGRATQFAPGKPGEGTTLDYIRAVADAEEGFLTVLHAKAQGERRLDAVHCVNGHLAIVNGDKRIELEL